MKRSLFITIAVLIVMALFVGCKAEIADRDELGTVSITEASRSLDSSAVLTVDAEDLCWFYTAVKADNSIFVTGATGTTKTPVKTGAVAGLAGANLGKFSTGAWTFCFYGYYATNVNNGVIAEGAKPVYYQEGMAVTVSKNVSAYLTVTLTQGEGMAKPKVAISGATWAYLLAGEGKALTLKVYDGEFDATNNDENLLVGPIAATTDANGTATFSTAADFELTAGDHTLYFYVYYPANENQLVGQTPLQLSAKAGLKYTITDLQGTASGIEVLNEEGAIYISGSYNPDAQTSTATGTITVSPTVETVVQAGVAPVETKQTTVTFPAGSFETAGDQVLTIAVADTAAAAETNFVVTNVDTTGAPIAVLSFSLSNAPATFGDEAVEVETFIQPGLDADSIKVIYNGTTGAQPTDVAYDSQTGRLTFKTTHFSDYVIVYTKAVARIGSTLYESLPEACVAALGTEGNTVITLLCDASGDGFSGDNAPLGSYTIDFAGHTYNVTGLVGSEGTPTQAFRVIDGQTVVLKNGKLTSSTAKMLINQYGNLTLKDMTLDGSNLVASNASYYTLSVCLGNVVISGNTNIIAHADDANGNGRAFDIDGSYSYGAKRSVTIAEDFTGKISGIIEFTKSKNDSYETKLIVNGGNGDLTEARLTISGLGTNDVIYIDSDVDWVDVYDLTTNTAYSLSDFRDAVNDGSISSDSFVLLKDVDLANVEWTPIGTTAHPFSGVFDGQNHTISNLTYNGAPSGQMLGLFGEVKGTKNDSAMTLNDVWNKAIGSLSEDSFKEENYTAVIKKLTLSGFDVTNTSSSGSSRYTGALAGRMDDAYIEGITVVNSTISGTKGVGGLVGSFNGSSAKSCRTLSDVSVNAIEGGYNIGGLFGGTNYSKNGTQTNYGAIISCENNASVTIPENGATGGFIGGIVGMSQSWVAGNSTATSGYIFLNCTNNGTIDAKANTESGVGGIAGFGLNVYAFVGCTNNGILKANTVTNGIAGISYAGSNIYNSSNTGSISANAAKMAGVFVEDAQQAVGYAYGCSNSGSLSNSNPIGVNAQIAIVGGVITAENRVFADVNEVYAFISGNDCRDIDFIDCTVADKSGELDLSDISANIYSNTQLCTTVVVKDKNVSLNIPNASVLVLADSSNPLELSSMGDSCTVTVEFGATIKNVTIGGAGSSLTVNGTVSNGITFAGEGAVSAMVSAGATVGHVGFGGTGIYTLTNEGVISHTHSEDNPSANEHTVSTIKACTITINNKGIIAARKNSVGKCSYAMLFYNGCDVVVNQYPDSSIFAEVNSYLLACGSASSVVYNTYDADGNLTDTVVKK